MAKYHIDIQNPRFAGEGAARVDPHPEPGQGSAPDGNITVAIGWYPDYVPRLQHEPENVHRRPEWRITEGAQKAFTTWGTGKHVLYQRIPIAVGSVLTFTCLARYTSDRGGVALSVGIDPFGGTDFLSSSVLWGPWQGETPSDKTPEHWPDQSESRTLSVCNVEAQTPYVTLFCRTHNDWSGKDASSFWQYAELFSDSDPNDPGPDPDPGTPGALAEAVDRLAAAVEGHAAAVEKLALAIGLTSN